MVADHKLGSQLNKWRVSPRHFEQQLQALYEGKWHVMTMSEMMQCSDPIPKKTVILTFDDGFANVFDFAFPLLKKYQFKSTHYLLSGCSENDWDAHKDSQRDPLLKPSQIQAMIDSGLVEIGVHGHTHAPLTDLNGHDVVNEITLAKQQLESDYHIQCHSFAYPFGRYDKHVIQAVQACGFDHALAVGNRAYNPMKDNRFSIPRLTIHGHKSHIIRFKLTMLRG